MHDQLVTDKRIIVPIIDTAKAKIESQIEILNFLSCLRISINMSKWL